jgi:hypothetical protein
MMQNLALFSITQRASYIGTAKEQGDEALGEPVCPNENEDEEMKSAAKLVTNIILGREPLCLDEAKEAAEACKVCTLITLSKTSSFLSGLPQTDSTSRNFGSETPRIRFDTTSPARASAGAGWPTGFAMVPWTRP